MDLTKASVAVAPLKAWRAFFCAVSLCCTASLPNMLSLPGKLMVSSESQLFGMGRKRQLELGFFDFANLGVEWRSSLLQHDNKPKNEMKDNMFRGQQAAMAALES